MRGVGSFLWLLSENDCDDPTDGAGHHSNHSPDRGAQVSDQNPADNRSEADDRQRNDRPFSDLLSRVVRHSLS